MKQKIVIKVQLKCNKCRSKALMIAAMATGVISVAIEGDKNDQVVIIGHEVDAAEVTSLIRKKVGRASLELVDEVKENVESNDQTQEIIDNNLEIKT